MTTKNKHTQKPSPNNQITPNYTSRFWIVVIGGIMTALVIGYALTIFTDRVGYFVFFTEVIIALLITVIFKQLVKISKYKNTKKLHILLIVIILLSYLSCHYFQYHFNTSKAHLQNLSFIDFISAQLKLGLKIGESNLGSIGLICSWCLQPIITYLIAVFGLKALTFKKKASDKE